MLMLCLGIDAELLLEIFLDGGPLLSISEAGPGTGDRISWGDFSRSLNRARVSSFVATDETADLLCRSLLAFDTT